MLREAVIETFSTIYRYGRATPRSPGRVSALSGLDPAEGLSGS
jgi:hypothetical protein